MNDDEKVLAATLYGAIQDSSNYSARSMQAKEFKIGVSDIGFCSERTRRMLLKEVPGDTDMLAAFIGTALGDHAEKAAAVRWPNAILQATVTLLLQGEERSYEISGHPDIILPEEGILIDVKTSYGFGMVRRTGPSDQQQYQRHGYALAAWRAGMFGDLPLEEIRVANIWIDRSAIEKELHCDMEPFDMEWVNRAGEWLDEVTYSYVQTMLGTPTEARKEPPREMCAVACGFFSVCRAYDTDVEGLIRDEVALTAVSMYREGLDLEKQGKKLKDEAKQNLVGVQGSTGEYLVRWTHINESVIPETTRRGYDKLDLRKMPKAKTVKATA